MASVNSPQEYAILQAALQKRRLGNAPLSPQEQEYLSWYDQYRANPTPQSDEVGKLVEAERENEDAGKIGRTSAVEDARRAGTYADEPNFMRGLDYEAANRAKGIQTASQSRIAELKKQLGIPS